MWLISTGLVVAVEVEVSQYPNQINSDPFIITVNITGAKSATNYLRVDLYKEGSTNYFGETYNGTTYYSGSDGTQYFPITITDSSPSAQLTAKIGSPSISEFSGSGNYKLRIRRYTASGSTSSSDSQNPVDIQINVAVPTPTPTQIPPSNTPKSNPTNTPKPTSTNTPKPTLKPTNIPTMILQVLSVSTEITPTLILSTGLINQPPTPTPKGLKPNYLIPSILISLGLSLLGLAIYKIC